MGNKDGYETGRRDSIRHLNIADVRRKADPI